MIRWSCAVGRTASSGTFCLLWWLRELPDRGIVSSRFPLQPVFVTAISYGGLRYRIGEATGGQKPEAVVDTDNNGVPKEFWVLHWEQHQGGTEYRKGKLNVYLQHMNGSWSAQSFWGQQGMNDLANTIQSVKTEEPAALEEPLPVTIQWVARRGRGSWQLRAIGHQAPQPAQPSQTVAAPAPQQQSALEARVDKMEQTQNEILRLLQELNNKQ